MTDLNVVLVAEHVYRDRVQRSLSTPHHLLPVPDPSWPMRLVRRWRRSKPGDTTSPPVVVDQPVADQTIADQLVIDLRLRADALTGFDEPVRGGSTLGVAEVLRQGLDEKLVFDGVDALAERIDGVVRLDDNRP